MKQSDVPTLNGNCGNKRKGMLERLVKRGSARQSFLGEKTVGYVSKGGVKNKTRDGVTENRRGDEWRSKMKKDDNVASDAMINAALSRSNAALSRSNKHEGGDNKKTMRQSRPDDDKSERIVKPSKRKPFENGCAETRCAEIRRTEIGLKGKDVPASHVDLDIGQKYTTGAT